MPRYSSPGDPWYGELTPSEARDVHDYETIMEASRRARKCASQRREVIQRRAATRLAYQIDKRTTEATEWKQVLTPAEKREIDALELIAESSRVAGKAAADLREPIQNRASMRVAGRKAAERASQSYVAEINRVIERLSS